MNNILKVVTMDNYFGRHLQTILISRSQNQVHNNNTYIHNNVKIKSIMKMCRFNTVLKV